MAALSKKLQQRWLSAKNNFYRSRWPQVIAQIVGILVVLIIVVAAALNRQSDTERMSLFQSDYVSTNFTVCQIPNTFVGTHHETGFTLFRKINGIIQAKRNENCKHQINKNETKPVATKSAYHDGNGFNAWLTKTVNQIKPIRHTAIMHIFRNPMDTILSGYNYHKVCGEGWASRDKIKDSELHIFSNFKQKMKELNANYSNMTLQNVLNTESMEIGIEIEYFRYLLCEHPLIQSSFEAVQHVSINFANDKFVHASTFRLEEFVQNFIETAGILMDVQGIFDEEQREGIMDKLQAQNLYDNRNDTEKDPHAVKHQTRGSYDRKKQISALLSNEMRCKSIKQMVESLNYEWIYKKCS